MADGRPGNAFYLVTFICLIGSIQSAYVGKLLGKLSELHHGVSGEVYAVDARTLHIKDFTYDGEGPAAYFYVGTSRTPSNQKAFRVPDETGNSGVLKRYRRKSITLTLPDGKNLNNINWFSVWCDEFAVNFGDVKIPRNFDFPKPQKIEPLRGVHSIASDPIVIVDAQTILVPHFSYDGEAPDAKFWVGRGSKPSPQGIRIPDENGKVVPLRRYDGKTVVLTLPGDLTVFDIGHFGVWCEAFTVDFGHIRIPSGLNVPPSLKMLGVSPQSKLNCEVLHDELAFEVRWAVAGDSIVLQLVAKLDNNEYMSFGLSGDDNRNQMIGGDVVVAWVDKESMKGYAIDYFLQAKSQCSGPTGSCPDEKLAENTNNIRLLNAAMVNGYSIVTYQRPLKPQDEFDRQIYINQSQAIIWATGPLNQRSEVSFHSNFAKKTHLIDFGRPPKWNCPLPESAEATATTEHTIATHLPEVEVIPETTTRPSRTQERRRGNGNNNQDEPVINENQRRRGGSRRRPAQQQTAETVEEVVEERPQRRRGSQRVQETTTTERPRPVPTPKAVSNRNAWHIPPIQCYEPDDGVFYAQMGPTGGKRGYPAITGHVGWGISWYINGLLIPEINVVRGKQYTFVVEGGINPDIPAKYHPFYITDDSVGGYAYKTPEERQNISIFAGARQSRDGSVIPNGLGRLCHWTHTGDMEADDFPSFGAFQRTLELRCDEGEPGVITWTPDANTPDTVYYQCFTHRYLGWKINVLDSCDAQSAASDPEPSLALPDDKKTDGDLKSSSSIIVETRINPNDLFQTRTKPSSILPEDKEQYDSTDPTPTSTSVDQQIITEKATDITYILTENNKEPLSDEKLNFGETLENLTSTTLTQDTDIIPPSQTRDKLLESPNNQDPLEMMSLMYPAGRLPLEPQFGNIPRRPVPQRPMHMNKPIYVPIHRPHNPIYKKHFYRTPIRRGPIMRPIAPIPHVHPTNPVQNTFALTQEPVLMLPPPKGYMNASSTTPLSGGIPETTTTDMPKLRPAINTGFHPESVVIESGFRPIINKEFEKRMSEDIVEPESDIGVIRVLAENTENSQKFTETFEPMFIPSPLDSHSAHNKKYNQSQKNKRRFNNKKVNPNVMIRVKSGRSDDETFSDDGDEMVMAAEKIESYYLPPDDKRSKPVGRTRKPSNIDIPPGSVVTYDGKTVSGVSLTAPVSSPSTIEARSSKQSDLLRRQPQFGPFRGEKPPLNPREVNIASVKQLGNQGIINRNLGAPEPIGPQTTRLTPVRYRRDAKELNNYELPLTQDFEDVFGVRDERAAHHTPEHTAEQKRIILKLAPGKKYFQQSEIQTRRMKRFAHHTPEHTAEQKRKNIKLGKKVEKSDKRTKRDAYSDYSSSYLTLRHRPYDPKLEVELLAEASERDVEILAPGKKFVQEPKVDLDNKRAIRSPHHTPEHTAQQEETKTIPGKIIKTNENKQRAARSAHHTPEHTAEQKRENDKLNKKVQKPQHENKKTRREAHHTPDHTAEQKREGVKSLGKKFTKPEQTKNERTKREAHHTPEHTAEQKKEGAKNPGKKFTNPEQSKNERTKREAHHTPEHTAEQKREGAKNQGKKFTNPEQTKTERTKREAHHTPEHTAEQKREGLKNPGKKVTNPEQPKIERTKREAHHTPEHTAEQKRESAKTPGKKFTNPEQTKTERTKREAHHTPEHTAEQKREGLKNPGKKFTNPEQPKMERTKREAHHTPEHTAEQKRESAKTPGKKFTNPEQTKTERTKREAHHTPEHTAEQKREGNKNPGKKFTSPEQTKTERTKREAHHTPEHTAEQKRASLKNPGKKFTNPEQIKNKRTKREAHHTPEHTAEQKREGAKNPAKKFTIPEQTKNDRTKREAHHTPEHTAEQKREGLKNPGKKFTIPEQTKNERTKREAHHTPEHTAEQKRESAKNPGKKFTNISEQMKNERTKREAHHTPEHTAEQKREGAKFPGKKFTNTEQIKNERTKREAHHTLEHTAEQKRESAKSSGKKFINISEQVKNKRTKREAHHTPEHTAEQMKQMEQDHGHDHDHHTASTGNIFQPLSFTFLCVILTQLL